MKKKVGKIDTIQKLAASIEAGFKGIERRFDKRFDKADALIEKLAAVTVEEFAGMNERFDEMDGRFVNLESEVRNGFEELRRILNRHDTRISLLELKVFGFKSSSSVTA